MRWRRHEPREERRRGRMIGRIFMMIGILTVLYLFITLVLVRILAYMTPN